MSEEILIPMFCRILDTIAYLHQNNVIHLDIKPSNMMVLTNNNIKILDMGISAIINDKSNNLKKCGSPAFMAPEQINQDELGFYTDIFALGVTLFNMVTCKLPFSGNSHTEIFEKICKVPTPHIEDFYQAANPLFQKIIESALQKNWKERYQTCEEFQMELLGMMENKKQKTKNKKNQ
jgi:serine/threonine-protein kinase